MKKPIIGILPLVDVGRESYWMLPGYMRGCELAGGVPVMLPLTDDPKELETLVSVCDGFLFSGGQDVCPETYGASATALCGETVPERDRMEAALLPLVLAADKPVLGICRGIQVLNALLGGTLTEDIPALRPSTVNHRQMPPYDQPIHSVALVPGSPLAKRLGKTELAVNSCHHQCVDRLAAPLAVMAAAPDGIVEAVYHPEKRFFWAVQWHPEFMYRVDGYSREIFAAFVEAAGRAPRG